MEVKNIRLQCKEIRANRLDQIPDRSKALDIHVNHKVKIDQSEDKRQAILHLFTTIGPQPRALFEIQITQLIQINFEDQPLEAEILANAYALASNASNQLSFITGLVSRELIDTPIIIPPQLNAEGFEVL